MRIPENEYDHARSLPGLVRTGGDSSSGGRGHPQGVLADPTKCVLVFGYPHSSLISRRRSKSRLAREKREIEEGYSFVRKDRERLGRIGEPYTPTSDNRLKPKGGTIPLAVRCPFVSIAY